MLDRSRPYWPRLALSAALGLVFLQGCSQLPVATQTNAFSLGSWLGGKSSTFNQQVAAGRLDEASSFYRRYRDELQHNSKVFAARAQLATQLLLRQQVNLQQSATRLEQHSQRGRSGWIELSAALAQGKALLASLQSDPLLLDSGQVATAVAPLAQQITSIEGALQARLDQEFAQHLAQAPSEDFFALYPLQLSQSQQASVLQRHLPALTAQVAAADQGTASQLLSHYRQPAAGSPVQQALAQAWIEGYARRQHWRAPLTLTQRVQAANRLRQEVKDWPGSGLSVALLPLGEAARLLPALDNLKQQLAAEVRPAVTDLRSVTGQALAPGFDLALLIAVGSPQGGSLIVSSQAEPGQYLQRQELQTNPELAELRSNLHMAERTLREVQQSNYQMQQQSTDLAGYGGNYAMLGALGQVAGNVAVSEAQSDVDEARQALYSAPQQVAKNVYADYQRQRVTYRQTVTLPVYLVLADVASQQFYPLTRSIQRTADYSLTLPESVHPQDRKPPQTQMSSEAHWQQMANQLQSDWTQEARLELAQLLAEAATKPLSATQAQAWLQQVQAKDQQQAERQKQQYSQDNARQLAALAGQHRPPAQLAALPATVPQNGSCQPSLSYLASELPNYLDPILNEKRQAILSEDINAAKGFLRSVGKSFAQGAEESRMQAQAHSAAALQAAETARQTAGDPHDNIALAEQRLLPLNWRCEGIHGASVCAYILNKWQERASYEVARQLTCSN